MQRADVRSPAIQGQDIESHARSLISGPADIHTNSSKAAPREPPGFLSVWWGLSASTFAPPLLQPLRYPSEHP